MYNGSRAETGFPFCRPLLYIRYYYTIVFRGCKEKGKRCDENLRDYCEYNPFHFGHLYQLEEAKRLSGCDAVVCVMSGSFVQRGEAAVCGRYERARHAVLSGADAVLELPAVFSTSSAELFARGAVKLLASLPGFSCLCFGAESGTPEQFAEAARALDEEPECVSEEIGRRLREGESFVRARASAWKGKIPE